MTMRIAIGSLFIECNHLGGSPADLEAFRRSELLVGADVSALRAGTVGGMLEVLERAEAKVVPLAVASACPSGTVTDACYAELKRLLLAPLDAPVDGVLLALHGSAASDSLGDLEGDLLAAVRERVGERTPIIVSLDHHAHVTELMMRTADGFVAWETYPHRDARETGERAARMLLDVLAGRLRPTMALAKVPVLVSGVLGHTEGDGPFADVMRRAKAMEQSAGAYSASAFLVHPYLDVPDMGGGGLVVTHDDAELAQRLAEELAVMYWERRQALEPRTWSPEEAVRAGLAIDGGPIVLVETADCCGGGAAGDAVASLRALLAANVRETCLVPLVDPTAAAACHAAGVGAELALDLGHQVEPRWGDPARVVGRVARLSDGRFTYRGGIWQDRTGEMGLSALLEIGSIQVAIASHATYEWCGEQYESLGMDARRAKFVVAKNPMNFHMTYGAFARGVFILDTPGPTPPTLKNVRYRHVSRPYFPADVDVPGMRPSVIVGRNAL